MGTPLRALIIEDSEDDAALLLRELRRGNYSLTYERIQTAKELSEALDGGQWDVILSDYSLPTFSAPEALKVLQRKSVDVPFIIISGTVGEDIAVAAMKAGAQDFFSKGNLQRLIPAMERELREAEERHKRRWVERELSHSEERFTKAFHASPIGISISNEEGLFLDVNEHFLTLLGAERSSVIGHTSFEMNLWHDPSEFERIREVLKRRSTVRNEELKFHTHAGIVRDALVSFEMIDLGGEPCVLILMQDITEQKKAQDELRALYEATSYLFKADSLLSLGQQIVQAVIHEFEQVDCGLMLVDEAKEQIIRLARAGEYSVRTEAPLYIHGGGLVPEAVRLGKIVYAQDVTTDERYLSNNPATRSELVVPMRTAQGILGVLDLQSAEQNAFNERDRRVVAAFAERAGAAIESMQLYEELNRRAAELEWRVAQRTSELQRAKDRVEAILNNSSNAIILVEASGVIQQTNQAFSQLFGYDGDAVLGRSLTQFIVAEQVDMLREAFRQLTQTHETVRIDLLARRKDGTVFNAEVALAPVMEYEGQSLNVICNLHDITQRKQAEEELRTGLEKEKELNELKSRFISMVSHEFRTPMSTIMAATDTLREYNDRMAEDRRVRHLDKIHNQITRMTSLLNDVLTISRTETVGLKFIPKRLNLDVFCQEIVEEFQLGTAAQAIQYSFAGENPFVHADEELIRQIITNLLSNALKYSPARTPVTFMVSCDPREVCIQVSDQGIGIPEEDQKHLFQIFHRAGNVGTIQGTGLGLAIVKRAVDAHHGDLSFDSRVGAGTTFTVKIPIASAMQ